MCKTESCDEAAFDCKSSYKHQNSLLSVSYRQSKKKKNYSGYYDCSFFFVCLKLLVFKGRLYFLSHFIFSSYAVKPGGRTLCSHGHRFPCFQQVESSKSNHTWLPKNIMASEKLMIYLNDIYQFNHDDHIYILICTKVIYNDKNLKLMINFITGEVIQKVVYSFIFCFERSTIEITHLFHIFI